MFTNFLVPLDGSPLAEQALPTAVSLVKQRHGRLELAVVHEPVPFDGLEDAPWNSMSESMQDRYVTDRAEQLRTACEGVVGCALLHGNAADEICRRACDVGADMIVMSSHARTGLTRALAGSVADAVIRQAGLPVLLLRQPQDDRPAHAPPLEFKKILVPVDDSAESRGIFEAAAAVARPGMTELVILRVVPPVHIMMDATFPYGYVSGPPDEDATTQRVADADQEIAGAAMDLTQRSACAVDRHVVVAERAGAAILDFARKHDVDLIAMTTHGRGASRMFIGSVADAVLRGGDVPMLLLRPKG